MVSVRLHDLVPWLISRRLIDRSEIVAGALVLTSAARRNVSFIVERRGRPGLFVKLPSPERPGRSDSLRVEASFYELCRSLPGARAVTDFLPGLVSSSPGGEGAEDGGLVLELVRSARSLRQTLKERTGPELPRRPFISAGRALAAVHDTFRGSGPADLRSDLFEGGMPQALRFTEPRPGQLHRASPARLEVVRLAQAEPAIRGGLERARAGWRRDTLIHTDLRWANLLVVADESPGIRLIDWEFARRGDAAWDVGCILADGLLFWLGGMDLGPLTPAAERIATAEVPLDQVRSVLGAFWRGYTGSIRETRPSDFMHRAVDHAGARLLALASEHTREGEKISSLAVLLLQLSANLLADPGDAARDLFGLRTDRKSP